VHLQNFKLVKVEGQRCYAEYDDFENRVIRRLTTFKLGRPSIHDPDHWRVFRGAMSRLFPRAGLFV
jgi:hypothetical protein